MLDAIAGGVLADHRGKVTEWVGYSQPLTSAPSRLSSRSPVSWGWLVLGATALRPWTMPPRAVSLRPVRRRWRVALRVVLVVHAGHLAEGLALIQDAQGQLGQRPPVRVAPRPPDLALREFLEHLQGVQRHPRVDQ